MLKRLLQLAIDPQEHPGMFVLGGRTLVWLAMCWVAARLLAASVERSGEALGGIDHLLSMANLVFHEAGHVIFSFLGDFMATLGGSLLQVLIPVLCAGALLLRHDNPFGAACCAWWTGQSLIDLALYINDARAQVLVLLGGVTGHDVPGYHDWNNILGRLGLLELDGFIASMTHGAGALLLLLGICWGGWLLWGQWNRRGMCESTSG